MANNLSGFSMKDQVTAALRVLIQTEHIHNYLLHNDPKALQQAKNALELVKPASIVLLLATYEAHVMMRALAEPAPVDTDVPIREWIANRLYSQLPPEHQIQPEPDPRCEECGKPFRGGRYCDECTAKFQAGENKR